MCGDETLTHRTKYNLSVPRQDRLYRFPLTLSLRIYTPMHTTHRVSRRVDDERSKSHVGAYAARPFNPKPPPPPPTARGSAREAAAAVRRPFLLSAPQLDHERGRLAQRQCRHGSRRSRLLRGLRAGGERHRPLRLGRAEVGAVEALCPAGVLGARRGREGGGADGPVELRLPPWDGGAQGGAGVRHMLVGVRARGARPPAAYVQPRVPRRMRRPVARFAAIVPDVPAQSTELRGGRGCAQLSQVSLKRWSRYC